MKRKKRAKRTLGFILLYLRLCFFLLSLFNCVGVFRDEKVSTVNT